MQELGSTRRRSTCKAARWRSAIPIGSSGARMLTTLLYALKHRGKKRGIATLCLGGGNGVALAVGDWLCSTKTANFEVSGEDFVFSLGQDS